MQGFYPRGWLLAARIVSQSQIIRLPRLRAQRVQWCQHLDSALPLLTLYCHPTISGEDVKHIQSLGDVPWHLLQPCQRTVRSQRGRHRRLTHTATGSGECLLDNPVSSHRIWRGVLDSGQELQALVCTLVVRPLLHEVMIGGRRSVIAIQTHEHFCLSMQRSLLRVWGAQRDGLLYTGKLLRYRTGHASANRQRRCRQVGRPQQGKGPFFFADALLLGRAERRCPQRRRGAVEGSKPFRKVLILAHRLQQYEELIQHLE